MTDFTFNTTPSIRQQRGGAARMGEILGAMPFASPGAPVLFVTDTGIMSLGLADAALSSLAEAGFSVTIFDAVEPDPKATTVLEACRIARDTGCACVLGFGGGSSMDVAKVVSLNPGMGVKKLVALVKQSSPDLAGVGAKEVRQMIAELNE